MFSGNRRDNNFDRLTNKLMRGVLQGLAMQSIALWLLISFSSSPVDSANNPPLSDGTLLFLENCNSVVEFSTGGKVGHVALAFSDGNETWIYEATPAKVRRVRAPEYYAELARLNKRRDADEQVRVWMLRPEIPYTDVERGKMREFLDAQVGRRYSVKNYVKGKPGDGIHCAELASTTLTKSGRYRFEEFHRINPQALYTAVLSTHEPPREITIPDSDLTETWCVRAQRRWAECWTWCGWSCGEAWALCW